MLLYLGGEAELVRILTTAGCSRARRCEALSMLMMRSAGEAETVWSLLASFIPARSRLKAKVARTGPER
jgi:hypothetical protein